MKQFILGGARSGKSQYAQQLAEDSGKKVIYIATATAGDEEMKQRILQHKQQRPDDWQLIEEPVKLSEVLQQYDNENYCLLVDCLTLWLSNCLALGKQAFIEQQQAQLIEILQTLKADVLLVSNEVGQGIVPANQLARKFVDESGRLHQRLAGICERVVFLSAGLPQILKDEL